MIVYVPVSIGELLDKITILEIKLELVIDQAKRARVKQELEALRSTVDCEQWEQTDLFRELKAINLELWHVENYKRACERSQEFGEGFVNASRQVYIKNDQRAEIKQRINHRWGSTLEEVKQHI